MIPSQIVNRVMCKKVQEAISKTPSTPHTTHSHPFHSQMPIHPNTILKYVRQVLYLEKCVKTKNMKKRIL